MSDDHEKNFGDALTVAGQTKRPPSYEVGLGDKQTILGSDAPMLGLVIDDIEVVDLEARYKIEGTLGQGGMGAVLLATDTRLGRKVAIKRILGDAAHNTTAIMRFLTEAKAIAALNHPNIVQIYDYGRTQDGPFLIMEYVDGGSLADLCKVGAVPFDKAVDLVSQVCAGLGVAHERGIVHRDIKPANILINKSGVPKLTDFGLAKAESGDDGVTVAGTVMGTPDFMPPEQRRDAAEVDRRSDLWSLAATLYQAVTGRSPKIIRFDLVPAPLMEVLGKALEDDKDARYQSAGEFRDALVAAVGGQGGSAAVVARRAGEGELQEGRCKACGTVTSDLTKKFCRNPNCGASLRVPCLKCGASIPVWDGVCGECAGNQPMLLEARRESLNARRLEAERLAAELSFDASLRCVEGLAGESRPEFADIAAWATSFVAATNEEAARRRMAAEQALGDARRHVEACDYPAAIQAIETIPEPLRDTQTSGLLAECRARRQEAERLIEDIAGRIKRKETAGLLPLVERALELRKDRLDLAKIRGQLRERRDGAMALVKAAMDGGDVRQAAALLAGFTAEDWGKDGASLLARVSRAAELESKLARAVAAVKADGGVIPEKARGLLVMCEEYLRLNPRGAGVKELAKRCRDIVTPPQFTNSLGMQLKLLPAGTFTMGQAGGDADETPHQVTLTNPFYMGVYEVTNAQWKRVMGCLLGGSKDDDRPVERVSWRDAVEFCQKLSALPEEKKAGRSYRLPTEAEWEYACRAGATTDYSFGDDAAGLGEYAWHAGNAGNQTHPVGQKKPNDWGLYDMHGNVWEWVNDGYESGYYAKSPGSDPIGPSEAPIRVVRGGSWRDHARFCRSAFRIGRDPSYRDLPLGFRVALSPS